jgi:hypothetical protein
LLLKLAGVGGMTQMKKVAATFVRHPPSMVNTSNIASPMRLHRVSSPTLGASYLVKAFAPVSSSSSVNSTFPQLEPNHSKLCGEPLFEKMELVDLNRWPTLRSFRIP